MAKILIVDDQKSFLIMLERILTTHNHEVVKASNAFDAIEALKQQHFDLLITDVSMPGRTGYDLVSTVHKMESLKNLPTIMLTGKSEKKDVEKGIEAGVNEYVLKPLDIPVLVNKVNLLLEKYGSAHSSLKKQVKISSQVSHTVTITEVGDKGLNLLSALACSSGSRIHLDADFYHSVGIASVPLKVIECKPAAENQFTIVAIFENLSASDSEALKNWLAATAKSA